MYIRIYADYGWVCFVIALSQLYIYRYSYDLGAIAFLAANLFVCRIYHNIKID